MPTNHTLLLLIILSACLIHELEAFKCYICDSKNDIECTENLPQDSRLVPQDCHNITGAKYCIKTTNVYAGELGTKRFCAAKDHGNFCKYIKLPTGDREYRSCVLTCDSELCNSAHSVQTMNIIHWIVPVTLMLTILNFRNYMAASQSIKEIVDL